MTPYDHAWNWWLLAFAVVEGIALARGSYEGTLTAHFRKWFGFETKRPEGQVRTNDAHWWRLRRALGVGFLTWLYLHLVLPAGWF